MSHNVNTDFIAALSHFMLYMEMTKEDKKYLKEHTRVTADYAYERMLTYKAKHKVDMRKSELLRDLVFLISSHIEKIHNTTQKRAYYQGLVKACMSLIELDFKKSFDASFINKILKSMSYFQCNSGLHFQAEAFYFMFKTHSRFK